MKTLIIIVAFLILQYAAASESASGYYKALDKCQRQVSQLDGMRRALPVKTSLEKGLEGLDRIARNKYEFLIDNNPYSIAGKWHLTQREKKRLKRKPTPENKHTEFLKERLRSTAETALSNNLSFENISASVVEIVHIVKTYYRRQEFGGVNLFFGHTALDILLNSHKLPDGAKEAIQTGKQKIDEIRDSYNGGITV